MHKIKNFVINTTIILNSSSEERSNIVDFVDKEYNEAGKASNYTEKFAVSNIPYKRLN